MKKQLLQYMLARYKRRKQRANNTSLEHCIRVAEIMLDKAKYCFLVSNGANGWCSARLVQPIVDKQFTLWVGTGKDLRKMDELLRNPKVTLAFENSSEDSTLVIYGNAFIETDPAIKKRYWKNFWQLFFPAGPESDDYVAIRIESSRIEILNFSRNIIPEPFGLKPAVLVNHQGQWQMEQA